MKTQTPRQTALRRVAMLVPGSTALTATAAFLLRRRTRIFENDGSDMPKSMA